MSLTFERDSIRRHPLTFSALVIGVFGVTSENAAGATHSPAARARRVVSTHD